MENDLQAEIEIAASPSAVWQLVRDPAQMPRWSPQVESVRMPEGESVDVGTRFTNRNRDGELAWVTHGEIVRYQPEREIAFRIDENWVTWSLALAQTSGGTLLTQRRETSEGISPLSTELADGFYGGVAAYGEVMLKGMRETLAAIKTTAEE
ncbi:SRPBCC family protein [Nocardioides sp. Bht2]|uniref:SRPBCC family protein n=1 Tax=Nocardioides sp. Bht2 TaxID=3392297 RepID=UPI0039B45131